MLEVIIGLINYAKKIKGLTDRQLAIMLGVNETTLTNVLKNKIPPYANLIFELIRVLNLERVVISLLSISHSVSPSLMEKTPESPWPYDNSGKLDHIRPGLEKICDPPFPYESSPCDKEWPYPNDPTAVRKNTYIVSTTDKSISTSLIDNKIRTDPEAL